MWFGHTWMHTWGRCFGHVQPGSDPGVNPGQAGEMLPPAWHGDTVKVGWRQHELYVHTSRNVTKLIKWSQTPQWDRDKDLKQQVIPADLHLVCLNYKQTSRWFKYTECNMSEHSSQVFKMMLGHELKKKEM